MSQMRIFLHHHGLLQISTSPFRFQKLSVSFLFLAQYLIQCVFWRSFEVAWFCIKHFQAHWNLTSTSAVALSRCLPNFKVIQSIWHPNLRLRDFKRSCGKTSVRLGNRGLEYMFRTDPTKAPARGPVHNLFTVRFQIGPKFWRGLIHIFSSDHNKYLHMARYYISRAMWNFFKRHFVEFQRKHSEMSMQFDLWWEIVKKIVPPYLQQALLCRHVASKVVVVL